MAGMPNTGGRVGELRNRVTALEQRPTTAENVTAEAEARRLDRIDIDRNLAAEVLARIQGYAILDTRISDEGKARSDADAVIVKAVSDEAAARIAGDKAISDRMPAILNAVLSFPAGISISVGKNARTMPAPGLKAGEIFTLTAKGALPANLSLVEPMCLADGLISLSILNTAVLAVAIAAKTDIPIGIAVHR